MGNPATLLLELFTRWDEATGSAAAASARGLASEGEFSDGDSDHVNAMRWIHQIREQIDALDHDGRRVAPYRHHLGNWTHIVLNYPGAWAGRTKSELITEPMLHTLELLSDALDRTLPRVNEEQRTTLLERLQEVVELLREDGTLPEDIKAYVYRVVQNAKTCVEDFEVLGEVDLQVALDHLWGALQAAEGHSEKGQRWASMREKIFLPAAAGAIGSLPVLALQAMQLLQITQGGG